MIQKNHSSMIDSGVIILHNNARIHVSATINEILAKYMLEVLPQPHSPDLSPCDYDLDTMLEELMCRIGFNNLGRIDGESNPENFEDWTGLGCLMTSSFPIAGKSMLIWEGIASKVLM